MAIYQGDNQIVDRYVGETLVTRTYQGDKLIFDAYSELSGTLPLAVRSRASQVLKNYRIYGASGGVGDKTVNLFDKDLTNIVRNTKLDSMGEEQYSNDYFCTTTYIPIFPGTEYSVDHPNGGGDIFNAFYDANKNFLMSFLASGQNLHTATSPANAAYIRCTLLSYRRYPDAFASAMLFEGSTAPTSYIPYGYKLPIKVTSNGTTTDYPLYIGDSQLMEGEYVDYEKQKIYKLIDGVLTPTDPPVTFPDITIPEGEIIIDIEGELKPQATIKGRINPTV